MKVITTLTLPLGNATLSLRVVPGSGAITVNDVTVESIRIPLSGTASGQATVSSPTVTTQLPTATSLGGVSAGHGSGTAGVTSTGPTSLAGTAGGRGALTSVLSYTVPTRLSGTASGHSTVVDITATADVLDTSGTLLSFTSTDNSTVSLKLAPIHFVGTDGGTAAIQIVPTGYFGTNPSSIPLSGVASGHAGAVATGLQTDVLLGGTSGGHADVTGETTGPVPLGGTAGGHAGATALPHTSRTVDLTGTAAGHASTKDDIRTYGPVGLGGSASGHASVATDSPARKLYLVPLQDGYTVTDKDDEVISIEYGIGLSRYSPGIQNSSSIVTAKWKLNPTDYKIFWLLYGRLRDCSLPFQVDLILDSSTPSECTARFLPGSVQVASKIGQYITIQATMEVFQTRKAISEYAAIVLNGTTDQATIDALNFLINNQLPGLLPG